jgi:putative FmdB family regulatory protein
MPLYEYYCDHCDEVFEALRSVTASEEPAPCPRCAAESDRIMPTTFASMSFKQGYAQRVPYHHRPVRKGAPARTIARVKPRPPGKRKPEAEGSKN